MHMQEMAQPLGRMACGQSGMRYQSEDEQPFMMRWLRLLAPLLCFPVKHVPHQLRVQVKPWSMSPQRAACALEVAAVLQA